MTTEVFIVSHGESKCFTSSIVGFVYRAICFDNDIILGTSKERRGTLLYLKKLERAGALTFKDTLCSYGTNPNSGRS